MAISGFIGRAGVSRSTRGGQRVFVNGRAVDNAVIGHALREGYHTALMKGRYPVVYLFIQMDPAAVDVNVHPAKREVRFREPGAVREAVTAAIRRTLEAGRTDWSRTFHQPPLPVAAAQLPTLAPRSVPTPAQTEPLFPLPPPPLRTPTLAMSLPAAPMPVGRVEDRPPPPATAPSTSAGPFALRGILGKLYVLMENANGLVLVDQHAAHERILFEEMRRRLEAGDIVSQKLLLPLTLQLPPPDADWLRRHLDALQKMGIGLEGFGSDSFKLDSLPPYLHVAEPLPLIREIIEALQAAGEGASRTRLGEEMIAKTVCRHAIKANDRLREKEVVRLVEDLLACELPYCCPHGRPTMIQLSYNELEKKFGRRA